MMMQMLTVDEDDIFDIQMNKNVTSTAGKSSKTSLPK